MHSIFSFPLRVVAFPDKVAKKELLTSSFRHQDSFSPPQAGKRLRWTFAFPRRAVTGELKIAVFPAAEELRSV